MSTHSYYTKIQLRGGDYVSCLIVCLQRAENIDQASS